MQVTHLTIDQAADVLSESNTITRIEWEGLRAHVITSATGRDCLLIQNESTGGALLIDDSTHDADSGGSVHDHARAIFADEPVAA